MSKKLPKVISKGEAQALLDQPNTGCPTGLRNRVALELMYRDSMIFHLYRTPNIDRKFLASYLVRRRL